MLSNVAGIDVPELARSWPVFDSTAISCLDPLSSEKIDEFIIADWMYDAIAEQVISLAAEEKRKENDEDTIEIKLPGTKTAMSCSRCKLIEPMSPSKIYDICIAFFHARMWYDLVAESNVRTPNSCFVRIPPNVTAETNPDFMEELEKAVKSVGSRKVFARMDHASPKKNTPCETAADVIRNLNSTERTASEMRKVETSRTIMLREYVDDMSDHMEIRCFVHGSVARACSLDIYIPECPGGHHIISRNSSISDEALKLTLLSALAVMRSAFRSFLKDLVAATEYHDFVADVAFHRSEFGWLLGKYRQNSTARSKKVIDNSDVKAVREKLWLIEINTPVYMLATSGHYCLDNKAHQKILLGSVTSVLTYPCMIASVDGSQELIEMFS
mmetsp:Transcript_46296/g.69848  ORF Transcript_46296/g.69848 Transcript_46296/m.69848 type:complete len:386 (+) Transcript_46296:46-1203(+)